jgi:hypothetical protein
MACSTPTRTLITGGPKNGVRSPDGNEVTDNVVSGNLACYNNSPQAQIGDSGGGPNIVGGQKLGECATL